MRLIIAAGLVLGACSSDTRPTTPDAMSRADAMPPIDAEPPPASCDPTMRQTRDRVDDSTDPQVHVVYAVPKDGVDRSLDTNGVLATSVAAWSTWLTAHTGGPGLRLDTCAGELDITYVALSQTDAELVARGAYVRDEIEAALRGAGRLEANKLYAVYHDGGSTWACGGGAWPPTLPGRVAAMYLHGTPPGATPCDQNPFAPDANTPGYLEYAMLHEIVHTLGLVAECAPNHTRDGHTSEDPSDLMYAGDQPWTPSQLDVGRNDYYGQGGSCADLARSALMAPTPADSWLPAGW